MFTKASSVLFVLWLSTTVDGDVDRTRQKKGTGSDVVESVVNLIHDHCIFNRDRLFLRRLAFVESLDGSDPNTFRNGYYGGLWQVDRDVFERTKMCNNLLITQMCAQIKNFLGINWTTTHWVDLLKPLYSGLAAALNLKLQIPMYQFQTGLPGLPDEQALIYANYSHLNGNATAFEELVNSLKEDQCESRQIDLGFIIDGSGSIGSLNFIKILNFIKQTIQRLNVGHSSTRVSILQFSSSYKLEYPFSSPQDYSSMSHAIDNIAYFGGGTDTSLGLEVAKMQMFSQTFGARNGAYKIAMVITDGASNNFNQTVASANRLRGSGVEIFALGIGSVNQIELENIASSPQCTHVFNIQTFDDIDALLHQIHRSTCNAIFKPVLDNTGKAVINVVNIQQPETNKTSTQGSSHQSQVIVDLEIPKGSSCESIVETMVSNGAVDIYISNLTQHPNELINNIHDVATKERPSIITIDGQKYNCSQNYATVVSRTNDTVFNTSVVVVDGKHNLAEIKCKDSQGSYRDCTKIDFLAHKEIPQEICSTSFNIPDELNPCKDKVSDAEDLHYPNPFDVTMYIRCDILGQAHVSKCPNGQVFNTAVGHCGATIGMESTFQAHLLEPNLPNPCNIDSLKAGIFFFKHPSSQNKFIYCDVWGHAYVFDCPKSKIWEDSQLACINDPNNPCNDVALSEGHFLFAIRGDRFKYIECQEDGSSTEKFCYPGLAFEPASAQCSPDILG